MIGFLVDGSQDPSHVSEFGCLVDIVRQSPRGRVYDQQGHGENLPDSPRLDDLDPMVLARASNEAIEK